MSSLEMTVKEQITGEELPDIVVKPPGPISRSLAEELIKYESKGKHSHLVILFTRFFLIFLSFS